MRRHQEILFAQLTASVINFGFCRPKEPVRPESFMPSQWERLNEVGAPQRKRMTRKRREKVANDLRTVMAQYLKKD
ncbi:MAG TPA: hypothetical protein VGT04_07060 [Acidobacteriaceae bacterium]|nr:hypothetical protein [Acidobacteriaceae bacterium]